MDKKDSNLGYFVMITDDILVHDQSVAGDLSYLVLRALIVAACSWSAAFGPA